MELKELTTHPRAARSRATVLEASVALLRERGPAGFTVDAVVERTGVAKTTIYRHWPTRSNLLAAAIVSLFQPPEIPDTGTLRGDLLEFFMVSVRARGDSPWDLSMETLPGIIEAAKRDPDLNAAGTEVISSALNMLRPLLERARARGEVRGDKSIDVMTHLLFGATFIHCGLGQDLTEAFVMEMVDSFLEGVRTPPPETRERKTAARPRS